MSRGLAKAVSPYGLLPLARTGTCGDGNVVTPRILPGTIATFLQHGEHGAAIFPEARVRRNQQY